MLYYTVLTVVKLGPQVSAEKHIINNTKLANELHGKLWHLQLPQQWVITLASFQELASSLWQGPATGDTKHNSFANATPGYVLDPNLPKDTVLL